MYIIVANVNNVILGIGNKLEYLDNGYPCLVEENMAYPREWVEIYDMPEITPGVEKDKYCFTKEKGFYLNPDWEVINPYGIKQDKYTQIIDDYTMSLIEQGIL